jgi:hypothetical protein
MSRSKGAGNICGVVGGHVIVQLPERERSAHPRRRQRTTRDVARDAGTQRESRGSTLIAETPDIDPSVDPVAIGIRTFVSVF